MLVDEDEMSFSGNDMAIAFIIHGSCGYLYKIKTKVLQQELLGVVCVPEGPSQTESLLAADGH